MSDVQRIFMFIRYHRCGQEKHLTVPAGTKCVCVLFMQMCVTEERNNRTMYETDNSRQE